MFKKHITATGTHSLSGKDVKTLRRDILKQYPGVTEEQLSEILPAKASVVLTKLNTRTQVYGVENGNPLFFDLDGRGALLPTVYALWALPQLVTATLPTWSEVSPKILGGADLFLQGVLAPPASLGDWLAGSMRTVSVPGNPMAFAIGRMAVSKTEAIREGMKGRGLQLLHHYPDLLWAMGDKSVPNEGFTSTRIFPLAQPADAPPADGAAAEAAQLQGLSLSDAPSGSEGTEAGVAAAASGAASGEGGSNDGAQADPAGGAAGDAAGGSAAAPSMDSLLEAAVLAGLRRVTNAELPMQTGDFYTKHMLACKPEGVVFDFKQSSYKKLGKLLDKFEKDKVLTQKVIRKLDNISAINRSHPLLAAAAAAEGGAAASSGGKAGGGKAGGSAAAASGGNSGSGKAAAVQISYCYRAPSSLRPLFGEAAARNKDRLYSGTEVEAALQQYAAAAGLAAAGGAIKLDQLLHGALFNKKEPQKTGDAVPAADVLRRLLDKLQLHHRLVRPGEGEAEVEVVRKGQVKPVSIADEKRSGRDVTKVAHLESFALAPEELAGVFQKKFQCSATVSKLPGKQESDQEVMLQGKLAKQVAEFLGSTYGIPAAFMEVKAGKK